MLDVLEATQQRGDQVRVEDGHRPVRREQAAPRERREPIQLACQVLQVLKRRLAVQLQQEGTRRALERGHQAPWADRGQEDLRPTEQDGVTAVGHVLALPPSSKLRIGYLPILHALAVTVEEHPFVLLAHVQERELDAVVPRQALYESLDGLRLDILQGLE